MSPSHSLRSKKQPNRRSHTALARLIIPSKSSGGSKVQHDPKPSEARTKYNAYQDSRDIKLPNKQRFSFVSDIFTSDQPPQSTLPGLDASPDNRRAHPAPFGARAKRTDLQGIESLMTTLLENRDIETIPPSATDGRKPKHLDRRQRRKEQEARVAERLRNRVQVDHETPKYKESGPKTISSNVSTFSVSQTPILLPTSTNIPASLSPHHDSSSNQMDQRDVFGPRINIPAAPALRPTAFSQRHPNISKVTQTPSYPHCVSNLMEEALCLDGSPLTESSQTPLPFARPLLIPATADEIRSQKRLHKIKPMLLPMGSGFSSIPKPRRSSDLNRLNSLSINGK
jgi:hypothetical protein